MRHLRDDTVFILDGEVRVYRRERSKRWQAAFSIDGKPIRIRTGKKDLNEAKEIARDTYLEYKFRHKSDLPVIEQPHLTGPNWLLVHDWPVIHYAVDEAVAAGAKLLIFITARNKRAMEDYFDLNS